MKTNFDIFPDEWKLLKTLGKNAELNLYREPSVSLIQMRIFSEKITEAIFEFEDLDRNKYSKQIDRINFLERKDIIPSDIVEVLHTIRRTGNKAAHEMIGTKNEAEYILNRSLQLANWFIEMYISFSFVPSEFIIPENIDLLKQKELESLKEKIKENEIIIEKERKKYENKLSQIKNEPNHEKNKRERRMRVKNYLNRYVLSEKETRDIIDEQLRLVGWEADSSIIDYRKGARPEKNKAKAIAEWPCKLYNGKIGRADYALFDGLKLVAVIEAKKFGHDIPGDLPQAKEYAKGILAEDYINLIEENDFKVPFIYSTNGRPYIEQLKTKSGIWFYDVRNPNSPERALEKWHSPEDLRQKLIVDINTAQNELKEEPFQDFASRYYQIEAVKAVEDAMANNQKKMLLAMATGTGKTRTALSIMYRLIKTKRVRRILFLVDRTSLGKQTADALKDTMIENISFSDIYDVNDIDNKMIDFNTKIQIATVQGMVRRIFYNDLDDIPSVGTFDFIIVDEAHRGYTEDRFMSDEELTFENQEDYVSQYRRVIDYFDASVLALTATPALHTTNIFGTPIYSYSYQEAVVDGYLVDHEPPYKFETELSRNGIHFEEDEEIMIWNPETYKIEIEKLPDSLDFEIEQFNKKVISENFNKVILESLVDYIDPNSPEKTLIFAATEHHAIQIVDILKKIYEEREIKIDPEAIMKITGQTKHSNLEIKKFKNEKNPNIVVTVDLLTTGIDVPSITNLVFMRRVKSRILYDQMLGRATRLCPEIGKESFKIFDAVHLYDKLQKITDMKPIVKNKKQSILDVLDNVVNSESDEEFGYYKAELMAKLQRKKQRLNQDEQKELSKLNKTQSLDQFIYNIKSMNRDEIESQYENIGRISEFRSLPNTAYISNHKDFLVKEGISRGYGEGNEKPEDYLNGFTKFVRENINLIPALNITVNKPSDLTIKDLKEIKIELQRKKYDEKQLQAAWRNQKKEFIAADIISFIRQAAIGSPLVDHDIRIMNAMRKIYGMNDWNNNQMKWLKRIESQLLETTVFAPTSKEYFDTLDVFKDNGGYKKIRAVLGDEVDSFAKIINDSLYG
ncbi:type I restriction-modification system endonuclease [Macrococcoides caseolyticum]|uniref:type I restriction-modification system endonuclease n=1 Tax=Macrococcoides caseolyticum TaxID=69966 RepID=UPI001F481822|nr:type I restriction-modification system endonuclease [Macrococcus caseolyticus]MCE4958008.1 type I restriction-modification system endonuclease [Macrococcus caseolyticus]